jgi:hypothetical protein
MIYLAYSMLQAFKPPHASVMFVRARYDRLLVPSTQFVLPDLFNALVYHPGSPTYIQNHYRFYDRFRT